MADEELIKEYCRGNAEAMTELFIRHKSSVYIWFKQVLPNDADDLYQELWFKVIKKCSSFSGSNFRVWMWKIARNMVIDVYKKKKPVLLLDEEGGECVFEAECLNNENNPISVFEKIDLDESRNLLYESIAKLPQTQKEVVLLRICSELSFVEISNILSLPLNTVLGRMHLAVKHLKTLIKERV